jgi:type IV secretion system protein VirD4
MKKRIIDNNNPTLLYAFSPNWFNQFIHEENHSLADNVIPKELEMDLYEDSGFFFGMKSERNKCVGKPSHIDGHYIVCGFLGSGKTNAIVIPSMMTWRGTQIIIDVKGNLYSYWKKLNKYSGKKVKVIRPGAPKDNNCRYDPFSFLKHGGTDNLAGNAKDLALALIPLSPLMKEPIWTQTAQNFLTGAIIYYFYLGCSFNDTMIAIQSLSITETIKK